MSCCTCKTKSCRRQIRCEHGATAQRGGSEAAEPIAAPNFKHVQSTQGSSPLFPPTRTRRRRRRRRRKKFMCVRNCPIRKALQSRARSIFGYLEQCRPELVRCPSVIHKFAAGKGRKQKKSDVTRGGARTSRGRHSALTIRTLQAIISSRRDWIPLSPCSTTHDRRPRKHKRPWAASVAHPCPKSQWCVLS